VALDRDRVRHVLLNLGENAVHRARPGGVITIRAEMGPEELTVTMADDGAPIPCEARSRIFQGAYHANGSSPEDPVGTGLWLYLSLKIVEAHGGHLWMPEGAPRGARFRFVLPLARPEPNAGRRRRRVHRLP
jgi:signal transduction histidine kinase